MIFKHEIHKYFKLLRKVLIYPKKYQKYNLNIKQVAAEIAGYLAKNY